MRRTYDFYEKELGLYPAQVDIFEHIINNVENNRIDAKEIRSLGADGLKFCICEGRYETFKKLIGPFSYTESGKTRYKYYLDAFSLGIDEFIKNLPSSIMEHWSIVNNLAKEEACQKGEFFETISVDYTARSAVVLYPELRKDLLNSLYEIDKVKIMKIKIKDVLPRQISGMGHPVRNHKDVIYYCEAPVLYAALDLFQKNIITTANDTVGCYGDEGLEETYVDLNVDYESLDEGNKLVADTLVQNGNAIYQERSFVGSGKGIIIRIPCDRNDLVLDVTRKIMKVVSQFHKQDMIYGVVTVDDIYESMSRWFSYLSDENKKIVNEILSQGYTSENIKKALEYFVYINYYYDSEEDKFWLDEFYFRRHKQYLEEQPSFGTQGLS